MKPKLISCHTRTRQLDQGSKRKKYYDCYNKMLKTGNSRLISVLHFGKNNIEQKRKVLTRREQKYIIGLNIASSHVCYIEKKKNYLYYSSFNWLRVKQ
jgi:hypothetical protein